MKQYGFSPLRPELAGQIQPGDSIVAGKNFGCGSSREQAPEIIKALPPCYLVTSKEDMLEHYTLQFAKALKENGMRFQLKDFRKDKKLTHAFSVFDPYLKESGETMNQMVRFFEKT